ncbi:MAG: porin [Acidobacteriia bacterium]|nr:porin [Terriglobia bacterium]
MKKTYGVCIGMLAMGLAIAGAPVARAQTQMAANAAGGVSEASTMSASVAPAASSPASLDRRVEELEKELAELRSELAARKRTEEAAAATPAPSPAAAAQDKPAEKTTIASLLGPTSLSGFIDTYYQVNFNHPSDQGADFRAFDFRSHQFGLNMAELILDKAPDASGPAGRTGYHVSLGFGDGMNAVNGTDFAGNTLGFGDGFFAQHLKEAYFSYLAPVGKGLQVDVGKYVTPMGSEVIESKDNWNYSRGLLFTYAIPFYHFGMRAKYTFNDKYALTGYLANGWNNIVDNNSGKMFGLTFNWNPTKKVSFAQTYMAGPEAPAGTFGPTVNVNNFWRQTWDTVVTYNPTAKLSLMANFDYGRGDRFPIESTPPYSAPVYWTGGAGYVKYALDANDYVAARYEYFEDHDGFMTATGIPRLHFNEFTATYQRTLATHLLTRFEYRRDMGNFPVFDISNFNSGVKYQNTATIGLIFLFDSRDAK